jgi:hypothetical protein
MTHSCFDLDAESWMKLNMDGRAQVAVIHLVDRSVDPALVNYKSLNIQNG